MKKILLITLALVLTLALAACGGNSGGTTPPAADNTPSGDTSKPAQTEEPGDDSGIAEDSFADIAEALGLSEENKRLVIKVELTDITKAAYPDGVTAVYQTYDFDNGAYIDKSALNWYAFGDKADYEAALNNDMENLPEGWVKHRNSKAMYYGFYSANGIARDKDGDGTITYKDMIADTEDDTNYTIIFTPADNTSGSTAPAESQSETPSAAPDDAAQSADWPENKYSAQADKPDWTGGSASVIPDTGMMVTYASEITTDEVKAYAQKLRDKGFTDGEIETDTDSYYQFNAKNAGGYSVMLTRMNKDGAVTLQITK